MQIIKRSWNNAAPTRKRTSCEIDYFGFEATRAAAVDELYACHYCCSMQGDLPLCVKHLSRNLLKLSEQNPVEFRLQCTQTNINVSPGVGCSFFKSLHAIRSKLSQGFSHNGLQHSWKRGSLYRLSRLILDDMCMRFGSKLANFLGLSFLKL